MHVLHSIVGFFLEVQYASVDLHISKFLLFERQ